MKTLIKIPDEECDNTTLIPKALTLRAKTNSSIVSIVLLTDIKIDINVHILINVIDIELPVTKSHEPQEYLVLTEKDPDPLVL